MSVRTSVRLYVCTPWPPGPGLPDQAQAPQPRPLGPGPPALAQASQTRPRPPGLGLLAQAPGPGPPAQAPWPRPRPPSLGPRSPSPLHSTEHHPFGATAMLTIYISSKIKEQGNHILSVDHWFLLFCLLLLFWAAAPKGTKSCRTHEEFLSVRSFVRSFVPSPLGLPKSKSGL